MFFKKALDKVVDKIEDRIELKAIEKEAYENEKPKVEAIDFLERVKEAKQKGVDKANKKKHLKSPILDKIKDFNEKMENNKNGESNKTKTKEKVEFYKFG